MPEGIEEDLSDLLVGPAQTSTACLSSWPRTALLAHT